MKLLYQAVFIIIVSFLFPGCGWIGPGTGTGGDVPSWWTDPDLFYEEGEYFPSRVVDYRQAPGLYSQHSDYSLENNLDKLLEPPSGAGIYGADNSSVVSLGTAGGYVVLEFDPPIEDHPDNIGGYDFIVYGNSFLQGGSFYSAAREPGVIEVMKDENNNGRADDTWYLIPGSSLSAGAGPVDIAYGAEWSDDASDILSWVVSDPELSGSSDFSGYSFWTEGESLPDFSSVFLLPDECFSGGLDYASVWGYADCAPTSVLGDFNGDSDTQDEGDYPDIDPVWFYTVPDTPGDNAIDSGSGGGSAIDLAWGVDSDFQSASLDEVSWIKITSASILIHKLLGEYSCEVSSVVRVRRQ